MGCAQIGICSIVVLGKTLVVSHALHVGPPPIIGAGPLRLGYRTRPTYGTAETAVSASSRIAPAS